MTPDELANLCSVHIDADGLRAELRVDPTAPGGAIDEMFITAQVSERGIRMTTQVASAIKQAAAALAAPRNTPFIIELARGTPPTPGVAGRIDFKPGFDPREAERARQAALDNAAAGGAVDHYTKTAYRLVKPGDHVATILFPSPGIDGTDVRGGTIPAQQPPEFTFSVSDTLLKQSDGRILALVPGVLEFGEGGLHISKKLRVAGYVDFSIGHVDFPGSVEVMKGVRDCFRVKAEEDITIHGLIEAATIHAGRDAALNAGMASKEKGVFTATRDGTAKYLNNVTATIGRDLNVQKEIVNCKVLVGRGFTGEACAIAGGRFTVAQAVRVGTLGSETGVLTELFLASIPDLESLIKDAAGLLPSLHTKRDKLKDPIAQLKGAGKLPASEMERLTELMCNLAAVEGMIKPLETKLETLRVTLGQRTAMDLVVLDRVYPKVLLIVGNYTVDFFAELRGPFRMTLDNAGTPCVRGLQGEPMADLTKVARVRKIDVHLSKAA